MFENKKSLCVTCQGTGLIKCEIVLCTNCNGNKCCYCLKESGYNQIGYKECYKCDGSGLVTYKSNNYINLKK